MKYFAADLTAVQIARLSGINRNTVNRYLRLIRDRIVAYCEAQRPMFGVVEVDESFFGARRVKGKRGRGAYGKTMVFGLYERDGMVYTEIVPSGSKATLQAIIRGRVAVESVINSDGWRGYDGLVDIGYGHFRVDSNLLTDPATSTASKASGAAPKSASPSSGACIPRRSSSTSGKPNSASIIANKRSVDSSSSYAGWTLSTRACDQLSQVMIAARWMPPRKQAAVLS